MEADPQPAADADPPELAELTVITRARAICAACLTLTGVYALAFIPAAPSLLGTHPVRLELLRASTAALVAGGAFARVGRASLVLALIAPYLTMMMSDPFLFWAGRLWGPDIARVLGGASPRAQRRTARALRLLERYDDWAIVFAYLLPVPSALIYAGAGWTGMSWRRFLILDLIGTTTWIWLIVGLGYAIGHPAVHVATVIGHYSLYLTIALVVAIVGYSALAGRSRTR